MASLMWNHAPDMWAGMKKQGIVKAELSQESAADLFAYFVSARYFEKPGDAGRGKLAFTPKALRLLPRHRPGPQSGGAACDAVGIAGRPGGAGAADVEPRRLPCARPSPNRSWPGANSPRRSSPTSWSTCRTCRETKELAHNFLFAPTDAGSALFQSKGCAGCHVGKLALETRLRNQTLTKLRSTCGTTSPA
jgi:hypothetical protein